MIKPPYEIIKDFEHAIGEYTKAPFVCCVNSCTNALRLCLDYKHLKINVDPSLLKVEIPKYTYVSVPIQIKQAGFYPSFYETTWQGMYELYPFNIWDAARRFTFGMYFASTHRANNYTYICVSFHWTKILGLGHGGAILHDDPHAVRFFEQMRHDGRMDGMPINNEYGEYDIVNRKMSDKWKHLLGHHCPMSPEIAAQGLVRLSTLPLDNPDLPNSNYPDLSTFEIFK